MTHSVLENSDLPFELRSLERAQNYQKWTAETIFPFLGQRILEVGSGIGNMSRWLPLRERLILSELEPLFLPYLRQRVKDQFGSSPQVQVLQQDLFEPRCREELAHEQIDTIVSFNVLEHIEKDELFYSQLITLLKESNSQNPKRLITFVPAHDWAMGSVDRAYGHFRRYSAGSFRKWHQRLDVHEIEMRYFNVIGLPGWYVLGNLLKRKELGLDSVLAFEKICPWIRGVDDFLHKSLRLPFGQSLLSVVEVR